MIVGLVLVWTVPLLLGSGLYACIAGWPRHAHERLVTAALGWVVGVLACAALLRLTSSASLDGALWRIAPLGIVLGLAAWALAWFTRPSLSTRRWTRGAPAPWLLVVAVVAVLATRGWLIASDVLLHPTLPWDAWSAWQAKAKSWVLAGQAVPWVSFDEWIRNPQLGLRTGVAWDYPNMVPWVMVWFASASGWVEPLLNLTWVGLWLALLLAQFGQLRALGVDATRAWVAIWLLGTLPLLNVHAALGGYVDLWLAVVLSQAVLSWLRWTCHQEPRQLVVALLLTALLPLLKHEGALWAILLGAACVSCSPRLALGWVRIAIAVSIAALLVALSFALDAQWTELARRYVEAHEIDATRMAASLRAVASGLWGQGNWNLLWFLLPAVLVINWPAWRSWRSGRVLFLFLVAALLLIVGVFTLSAAARHAQSQSAINRIILQLVPLAVALLVMATRPALSSADSAEDTADAHRKAAPGGI